MILCCVISCWFAVASEKVSIIFSGKGTRKSINFTSGFKGTSGALEVTVLIKRLIVNLQETGRRFMAKSGEDALQSAAPRRR